MIRIVNKVKSPRLRGEGDTLPGEIVPGVRGAAIPHDRRDKIRYLPHSSLYDAGRGTIREGDGFS